MKPSSNHKNIVYFVLIVLGAIWFFTQTPPIADGPVSDGDISADENFSADEGIADINLLTKEQRIVAHLKEFGELPEYYITKEEARERGWEPHLGNLCDVLPGHAIGGDRFGNREGLLPRSSGRLYYEADINYDCGHRTADRIVFSNDGLIYTTYDHYKTFHSAQK